MAEKRKFYVLRYSAVYATGRRASDGAQELKMGLYVLRSKEDGWQAVELCLTPVHSGDKPYEVSGAERSRLEAEITHARLMTAKPAKPPVEYIDMTPTWLAILPILLEGLTDRATHEAGIIAKEELIRMARAADAWNAHCRGAKP